LGFDGVYVKIELMEIKELREEQKELWNNFVARHPFGHLLQSWEWGDVLLADGQEVKRLAVFDKRMIIGGALAMKFPLPFNKSYLYLPRGPVVLWNEIHKQGKINKQQEALILILDKLQPFAQRKKAIFLRLDPEIEASDFHLEFWQSLGFKKAPREIQPKNNIVLDLSLSEETLLKLMKPKTRYNIRLAQRKGVKVKKSNNPADVGIFYQLIKETANRNKFIPHPPKHYFNIIKILGEKNLASLFLAEYKRKIIAANIISFFGQKSLYMHGASTDTHRNLMPTYLLQWEAILEAKRRGCSFYDLGGVVPEEETKHPWAGISRFKRGFGGEEKEFIGAWDFVYLPNQYRVFSFTNTLRHKIKGR